MKKNLFVVVWLALAMSVMSVFADGNQFEDSAVDANTMKQEQLAEREYFAAEKTEDEKVLFDNAHSDVDELRQEQIKTGKLFSGSSKTVDEDSAVNVDTVKQGLINKGKSVAVELAETEYDLFENAHNDANMLKQEQTAARKLFSNSSENVKEKHLFGKAAMSMNTRKQEQFAEREFFAAESAKCENAPFENAHNDGNVMKQEQLHAR